MVALTNSFAALASEVASSKAVEGHGDVQVKVHHPPRRSDSKGWTTVQSGRKHKGGKNVSQAEAKPASKKPAGMKPAGKNASESGRKNKGGQNAAQAEAKPAGKNAGESGRKNKGGQNAAQAGAKPAGKTHVPVTLGVFFDGAKYCPWKKPAVTAVVAETSRPAIVAFWPTPQEAYPAMVEAKTATTAEVEVKTTATAANKKRRNQKKRQQQQPNPSTSGPVPSTEAPVAKPAQVQDAEPASLGVEAELKEQIRSLKEALAAREAETLRLVASKQEVIDSLSKQLDESMRLVTSLREEINKPNKAVEDAGCDTPVAAAPTASPLKRASSSTDDEAIEAATTSPLKREEIVHDRTESVIGGPKWQQHQPGAQELQRLQVLARKYANDSYDGSVDIDRCY